jgi:hypothetical protein
LDFKILLYTGENPFDLPTACVCHRIRTGEKSFRPNNSLSTRIVWTSCYGVIGFRQVFQWNEQRNILENINFVFETNNVTMYKYTVKLLHVVQILSTCIMIGQCDTCTVHAFNILIQVG